MTDVEKLRGIIDDSGISITAIAAKIGISREGLYKKIQGETEFKASEIAKMKEILHLDDETRDAVFFA